MNAHTVVWHNKRSGYYLAAAEQIHSSTSVDSSTHMDEDSVFELCIVDTRQDQIRYVGKFRHLQVPLPSYHHEEYCELNQEVFYWGLMRNV